MEPFYAIIIGITQGITELLPISSSGHLILIENLFGQEPEVFLLTTLHLGSAFALLAVYWKEIYKKLLSDERDRFIISIIIAAVPVVLIGVLAGDLIDDIFYNPTFIAINLLFWGIAMILTERREGRSLKNSNEPLSYRNALIIGLLQMLALLPGTSRSGITTMAGMWVGEEKSRSLDFSFMLGIPLLFGAFFFSMIGEVDHLGAKINSTTVLAFLVSLTISYLAARILRKYSKDRFLTVFGVYRIILSLLVIVYFIV